MTKTYSQTTDPKQSEFDKKSSKDASFNLEKINPLGELVHDQESIFQTALLQFGFDKKETSLHTLLEEAAGTPIQTIDQIDSTLENNLAGKYLIADLTQSTPAEIEKLSSILESATDMKTAFVYLLISQGIDEQKFISGKYSPKLIGVFNNKESLVTRWVLDMALKCRMAGDQQIELENKNAARFYFNQSVTLYQRLATIIKNTSAYA